MLRLHVLAAWMLTAGVAAAQGPLVPWANKFFQKDEPPAVLVHDFGTVPKGTLLVHKLKITNIYDVPVQIIDIRKSCTCLEANPPQQVLQPHDTAELTLTMNADKFTGPNAQTFYVTFGPQYVSTAVIQVKATSRADVTLTPGSIAFGVVAQGTKPSQTVTVRYSGKQRDWKIAGAVQPAGPFDVKLEDLGRGIVQVGNPEYRLTVTLRENALSGPIQDTIQLRTNDPAAPSLGVTVSALVQPPVVVSPARVRFDDIAIGTESVQKVVVRAAKPFRIEEVKDLGDGLTVEVFPAAAPVQVVTVKFKPTAAGLLKRDIPLTTDLGTVTVPVEAVGK
jgi:hypothetical protein